MIVGTWSPCCKIFREGAVHENMVHSGLCREQHDGELGPTWRLIKMRGPDDSICLRWKSPPEVQGRIRELEEQLEDAISLLRWSNGVTPAADRDIDRFIYMVDAARES